MDWELAKAAEKGDVKFLRNVVASKPTEYFKSVNYLEQNMFHLAVKSKRVEFIREAMEMLPKPVVHFLLCQQDSLCDMTPLHEAALRGYNKIVKAMLEFYEKNSRSALSSPTITAQLSASAADVAESSITIVRPWVLKSSYVMTPFHLITENCREERALQLLSIDDSLFSCMDDCPEYEEESSPFVRALQRGFNRVVLKFLGCSPNWDSLNKGVLAAALGVAPNCSDEIFRLVLEMNLHLLEDEEIFDQDLLAILGKCLGKWAYLGKLYPFERVLKSSDYAPHLRRYLIDRIPQLDILKQIVFTPNCDEDTKVQVAKIIVDAYEDEKREELNSGQLEVPWLLTDYYNKTALYHAVDKQHEKLALFLLSLGVAKLLLGKEDQVLFLAIEKNCPDVAKKILDLVHQHGITTLLTFSNGQTVLHNAPKCKDKLLLKRLAERHLYLVGQSDDDGINILHSWVEIGELWPFQYVLKNKAINHEFRKKLIGLLDECDDRGRNPLHVAAEFGASGVIEPIVQLLLNAHQEFGLTKSIGSSIYDPQNGDNDDRGRNLLHVRLVWFSYRRGPWLERDNEGNTPQRKAISAGRDQLALQLLSPDRFDFEAKDILFTAIENKCHQVVKYFLDLLYQNKRFERRLLRFSGKNVLHIASKCSEANGKLIIERWPHLIKDQDPNGKTPLQIASEEGVSWLVKLILEKDRDSILKAPTAWVEACKRGHQSTILTFVESTYFKYVCRKHHDTPLHHVKFDVYNKYQELLKCPLMNELKNVQDFEGNTPLHKAIKDRNKELTEILFTMEHIYWNIKNNDQKTAMDLLEEATQDPEWADLCNIMEVDPRLKITYIQPKTDVTKMRETISLVATLLATIAVTAAFTLPGGFNNDNGDAILAGKASFLVFMIADVYAMCFSMLILFCMVWSMVCDRSKASFLADRSLDLFKHSLYGTLVAFMTGVYAVIHKKSLWAAIFVILMCSTVVILAQRRVLYNLLEMSNSIPGKVHRIQKRLSYYGKWTSFVNRVFSGNQQAVLPNNQSRDEEAAPLTDQSEHQEISPINNQSQDGEAASLTDQREDQQTGPLSNMLEMSNSIARKVHRIQKRLSLCFGKWTSFDNSVFRGKQQAVLPNNQSQDEEAAASLSEQSESRLGFNCLSQLSGQ